MTHAGLVKWMVETHGIKGTHAIVSNMLKRSNELLHLDNTNGNLTVKRHHYVALPLLEATEEEILERITNPVPLAEDDDDDDDSSET